MWEPSGAGGQNEHVILIPFFVCGQNVEVEKQSHFAIINMKTATAGVVSVCSTSGSFR